MLEMCELACDLSANVCRLPAADISPSSLYTILEIIFKTQVCSLYFLYGRPVD